MTPLGEMIDLGPTGGIFDADEAKRQGLIVHPTSSIGHEADFRVVKVPEVGDLNLPVVTSSRAFASDLRRQHPEVPRWYIDALTAGVDPVAFNLADPPMAKPAPANLGEVISGNYPLEIVGLTLMVCFGVVIVLDMRHREPRSVPDAQDFTL